MIQNGHMSREEGLELCMKYDGEFPQRYFGEVLEYLNLSESEFYDVVDKHRNKELWVKDKGRWKLRNPYKRYKTLAEYRGFLLQYSTHLANGQSS